MIKGPSLNVPQQGMNQSTAAMQSLMRLGLGAARAVRSTRKRKRSAKQSRSSGRRTGTTKKRAAGKKLKRLVKGSAAAKAYMAKIRRKRK